MAKRTTFFGSVMSGIAGYIKGAVTGLLFGGAVGAVGGAVIGLIVSGPVGMLGGAVLGAELIGGAMAAIGALSGAMTGVVRSNQAGQLSVHDVAKIAQISATQEVSRARQQEQEIALAQGGTQWGDRIKAQQAAAKVPTSRELN